MTATTGKRGRPSKKNDNLSADLIVTTAKRMMLEGGKVPSIRAIATELTVDPMALYYYFKNKNVLLEEVAKSLIGEIYKPTGMLNWELELIALSKSYLSLLHKYDGLLQTLLAMTSSSPADVFIGRFNQIVEPLSLGNRQNEMFLNVLVDYLHGFSLALACNNTGDLTLDNVDEPLGFLFQSVKLNVGGK